MSNIILIVPERHKEPNDASHAVNHQKRPQLVHQFRAEQSKSDEIERVCQVVNIPHVEDLISEKEATDKATKDDLVLTQTTGKLHAIDEDMKKKKKKHVEEVTIPIAKELKQKRPNLS
jgi:hypothetical protein